MDIKVQDNKQAIFNTLIYSDIFNYPLRFDQLYFFFISKQAISQEQLKKELRVLPFVSKKGEYYTLKGRESLVLLRMTLVRPDTSGLASDW